MQGVAGAAGIPANYQPPPLPQVYLKPSNARFRSFAERFMCDRIKHWPKDGPLEEYMHEACMQARTAYKMIMNVGRTLDDDN